MRTIFTLFIVSECNLKLILKRRVHIIIFTLFLILRTFHFFIYAEFLSFIVILKSDKTYTHVTHRGGSFEYAWHTCEQSMKNKKFFSGITVYISILIYDKK